MLEREVISGNLEAAFAEAEKIAKNHYENFPVVSLMIPKSKRKYLAVIYQFARTADDFADEGDDKPEIRQKKLETYLADFEACLEGNYKNDFWMAMHNTINTNIIQPENFRNLISAFIQDVNKIRYSSFEELTDYCKRSADPVGRLVLELHSIHDEKLNEFSDLICTALQLTNFWQDVAVDLLKNRIYLPQEDLDKFNVTEEDLFDHNSFENFRKLMKFEIERTYKMFEDGKKLIDYLPGKLKYQIKWTILGGEKVLSKIEKLDYNVFDSRPKLSKYNYLFLLLKALLTA